MWGRFYLLNASLQCYNLLLAQAIPQKIFFLVMYCVFAGMNASLISAYVHTLMYMYFKETCATYCLDTYFRW